MMGNLDRFTAIWVLDFEFNGGEGDNPSPVCLVAREMRRGTLLRLWRDEFARQCPLETGPETLYVAFYASAEWNCYLALGWTLPAAVIDLYAEFRMMTNNRMVPAGRGLLGALACYGLPGITNEHKADMRRLIMDGGPWTLEQQQAILDYCQSDVDGTARLLVAMASKLDVPRALLRGRYTQAVAQMENVGIPVDTATLADLQAGWHGIQTRLIEEIDRDFGVYDGTTFKLDRFERWLTRQQIPWPRLESGTLALDDDTFKEMARSYPAVAPIRELRSTLATMRLNALAVGKDGRNRTLLNPFKSTSGRNQPGNARFIFGPSTWLRSLIKPPAGYGLAYVDWSQQEFGIAAALSDDPAMMEAYASGDPYLTFAKQAGMAPADATKASHKQERDLAKACVLATQYGMAEFSLAQRIGQPPIYARQLLDLHRRTYRRFWQWSDGVEDHALLYGRLWTVYGWRCHYGPGANRINPRSIRNFPMQANGAEMLRLACILATGAGIEVCAPVHDAILIQAPLERLEAVVADTQAIMREASLKVLDGFPLRSDAALVRHPGRYQDERGVGMWQTVLKLLYGDQQPRRAVG